MQKAPHPEYSNTQIKQLICEYLHDKVDRKILFYRLVDGDTIAEIAEKVQMDDKTVRKRIKRGETALFKHFPG